MTQPDQDPLAFEMYERTHDKLVPSRRFGLQNEQMREPRLIKNAGWYDMRGQKLDWGDLSITDVARVARELDPAELFVVLSEDNSFWRHVSDVGAFGAVAIKAEAEVDLLDERLGQPSHFGIKDELAEKLPGTDFVAAHAEFAVYQNGLVFRTDNSWQDYFDSRISRDIPMELGNIKDRLDWINRKHGEAAAAEWHEILWPGDDIRTYAESVPRSQLEPTDFYLICRWFRYTASAYPSLKFTLAWPANSSIDQLT